MSVMGGTEYTVEKIIDFLRTSVDVGGPSRLNAKLKEYADGRPNVCSMSPVFKFYRSDQNSPIEPPAVFVIPIGSKTHRENSGNMMWFTDVIDLRVVIQDIKEVNMTRSILRYADALIHLLHLEQLTEDAITIIIKCISTEFSPLLVPTDSKERGFRREASIRLEVERYERLN
jgi:hypothetical protein